MRELGPGSHAELPEHLAQVVFHRAGTDEQLFGDLAVGRTVGGQLRNAGFLRGEVELGLWGSASGSFTSSAQFTARLFRKAGCAHGEKHVLGSAKLASRIAPSPGTPQPLTVHQVRAGQIDSRMAASELADRFEVSSLGVAAIIK